MIKIFQYECKRLLWNKFFFGLLLILLFYGWQVLNSVTILGVSSHRPVLSLEFRGLPEPHDSTAVDWCPLLFDILHIR